MSICTLCKKGLLYKLESIENMLKHDMDKLVILDQLESIRDYINNIEEF